MSDGARVLIFTGDGKGKTTAALGMALRAGGHGLRTCMIQFVKADEAIGEISALEMLETLEIVQTGRGFVPARTDPRFAEHAAAAEAGLDRARQALACGRYGLVILDEICFAVSAGLVDEQAVLDLVASAPKALRLVLTGRGATQAMVAAADTVTDMRCIKHGMETGWQAQEGVEY